MNIFNIISFYESVINSLKKNMNDSDLNLLNKQINYSYELAKVIKELAIKIKIDDKIENMNKYLKYNDNHYELNNYGITLAMSCALFHSIGYYIQILNYHEINDDIKDNQEIGLNYLIETKILKFLSIQDQLIIYEVVYNHDREMFNCVDKCCEFYVKLVKEAKEILNKSNILKR